MNRLEEVIRLDAVRAAAVALALVASGSHAAEVVVPAGQRVFVCAHSLILFTAKLLPPMAEAAGIAHINAGQQMIGGSRVIQHWNLPDAASGAKTALRGRGDDGAGHGFFNCGEDYA